MLKDKEDLTKEHKIVISKIEYAFYKLGYSDGIKIVIDNPSKFFDLEEHTNEDISIEE